MQLPDSEIRYANQYPMDLGAVMDEMQLRSLALKSLGNERYRMNELMRLRTDKFIPGTLMKADEVPARWDGTEPPFAFEV